jgi:cytochrome c oxidase subunit 2
MIKTVIRCICSLFAVSVIFLSLPALAEIKPWQINFPEGVTPIKEHISEFHTMLLYIITGIVLFVMGLLIYVMIRFNAKANPVPSTTTHNVALEVLWTVVPVIILIIIAVPSFKLLFFEARNPDPELTVKVIGNQWNWTYEYPDNGNISFTSVMIEDSKIDPAKGQVRLLSTDAPMVIPVDTNVVFQVTASDVLHAFAVPQFGVKVDAVPGRLNSTWARVSKTGTYFGQCSELCGKGHAFMPLEIKVVTKEEFAAWVKSQGGTMPNEVVAEPSAEVIPAAVTEPVTSAEPLVAKEATTELKTNPE